MRVADWFVADRFVATGDLAKPGRADLVADLVIDLVADPVAGLVSWGKKRSC